ncbi:MAG: Rab family GTPase [Promethearchaeota archaeon]
MKNYIFKILIIGNASVGKTTLLRRYLVNFFTKELTFDKAHCLLQLWDLGGQERFKYLLKSFVMGSRGALLLIDLTRMPIIKDILEWVNIARLHNINLPILLVGTKSDLTDLIAIDDESALHLKNTYNMIDYVKTSEKTGNNVDETFELIAKKSVHISKY